MTLISAACRWYKRLSGPLPHLVGLVSMVTIMGPPAVVGGLLGAAWGGGWWPGFGAGIEIGALLAAVWCLFVLATVAILRLRGVPLERYIDDRP